MKNTWMLLLVLTILFSCSDESEIVEQLTFEKPAHFPDPTYSFQKNPVTEKGFRLGKRLFNDPILSRDFSVACSNCHVKGAAFTDPQHTLSVGVEERSGIRNAPSIVNMAFMAEFLWDGGIVHLDFVPPNAIENELEMDIPLASVIYRLNQHSEYPALFRAAFPNLDTITAPYFLQALSQYQVMLVSANSAYDKYKLGKGKLSQTELDGLALFNEKCSSCHSGELFTDQGYFNNGLDSLFKDEGRARITESHTDLGKFRVPSLRNVTHTSPYMHDGRFRTLEEVLDHYSDGVVYSPSLAPALQQAGKKPGIPMSKEEKQRIIAFLKTLTDYSLLSDPRL